MHATLPDTVSVRDRIDSRSAELVPANNDPIEIQAGRRRDHLHQHRRLHYNQHTFPDLSFPRRPNTKENGELRDNA